MDFCEMLAQTEGHVSLSNLETTDRVPHHLANMVSVEQFTDLRKSNSKLQKLFDDMNEIYTAAFSAGLRIQPDAFGGFCLMNRTGSVIRQGEIKFSVGLLGKTRTDQVLDNWSLMEGEKHLVGIARWANHSCQPNCDYYLAGGFNGRECVRLRARREIGIGEELVIYYSEIFFW